MQVAYKNDVILPIIEQRVSDVLAENAWHAMRAQVMSFIDFANIREVDYSQDSQPEEPVLYALDDDHRVSDHDYEIYGILPMINFIDEFAQICYAHDVNFARLCLCHCTNRRYAWDDINLKQIGEFTFDCMRRDIAENFGDYHDTSLRERATTRFLNAMDQHEPRFLTAAEGRLETLKKYYPR